MAAVEMKQIMTSLAQTAGLFVLVTLGSLVFLVFCIAIYNLFLHPLAGYPGPPLARASRLWYLIKLMNGDLAFDIAEAHKKYGDTVRVAPNELSYIASSAWKDIFTYKAGKSEMSKDPVFYAGTFSVNSILDANQERHEVMRRLMSHGFTASALREQSPLIEQYVQLLVDRLGEASQGGSTPVDMVRYWNYLTFDVISDLAFGEAFGCLRSSNYHPWVAMILGGIKTSVRGRLIRYFPKSMQGYLARLMFSQKAIEGKAFLMKMTEERTRKRIEKENNRNDFLVKMVEPDSGFSMKEMIGNTSLLTNAGSETTATALSGLMYLLMVHQDKYKKLRDEINNTFQSESEITCESVQKLKYLGACIDETLRIFPPVVGPLPRVTPDGGDYINGRYVPGKTTVAITLWAMTRSPTHFTDPDEFVPERWLGDERYQNDERSCGNVFSFGPRNCLGRSLAYVEMRLAMAKVLWNFDVELLEESKRWMPELKTYFVWDKKPLMLRLKPIER